MRYDPKSYHQLRKCTPAQEARREAMLEFCTMVFLLAAAAFGIAFLHYGGFGWLNQ